MNRFTLVLALVLSAFSLSAVAETKIATINTAYIFAKAPQNDAVKQRLKSQFAGRENEIKRLAENIKKERDSLIKNAPTMSETQGTNAKRALEKKISDLQLKERNAKDDFTRATREEQQKVSAEVKRAVDAVAVRGGFNMVLDRQSAVFTDVSIPDLTEQVMAELKK